MTGRPATVTVLGLGGMGSALARAFLAAGHTVTVWNRTPARAEPLAERGAVAAATVEEAVTASELIVVCVVDYPASDAFLHPVADALRGRTLVNLTSDTPERAAAAAAWAAGHGIAYLDGAIMVPIPVIGGPGGFVIYSGSPQAYETHAPTLAALGGKGRYLGEDPAGAALYDLAMLGFFYSSMAGLMYAFALAGTNGDRAVDFVPYAAEMVHIMPDLIAGAAEEIDARHYPGDLGDLAMESVGIGHIVEAGRARGLDTGVLDAVKALTDRAVTEGHGGDGFARVLELLKR
ncbi:NAD(P)-dependent oxidoreductase [Streptomyces carpaticus]|uniref:NAD(P)-dependent oxidoreductase n=1 Tax=Streptomyces carpaticus TaxID=285558 RepID=A0ABV4ZIV7_9ACTN